MNTTLPTSEVLNRAADLIEERGWARGSGWPEPGRPEDAPLCLEGAIQAAMGVTFGFGFQCPAYEAVATYLQMRPSTMGLFIWNDQRAGSADRVIATLRAAALIEAAKERPANLVVFDAPTLAEAVQ